jgi:alkanesulfonate monooxygenase SsuD/methylene tetrahydromethanopterin reductase-like flavin-dependent oxidoreductase (luciferase family)
MRSSNTAKRSGSGTLRFRFHKEHLFPLRGTAVVLGSGRGTYQNFTAGHSGYIAPAFSPDRVTEEVATFDVLSNGRVEFGIGRGAIPARFSGFGVLQNESRERFWKALRLCWALGKTGVFQVMGDCSTSITWQWFRKPVQSPHPPVRVACNRADTFELMGQLGHKIFAASQLNPYYRIKEYLSI